MKRFVFLLMVLLIATITSAETIKLKSGKVIEGKIIEKTDEYIKIDSGEQVWKIKNRDMSFESLKLVEKIENIGGEAIVQIQPVKTVAAGESANWQDWINSIEPYIQSFVEAEQKFSLTIADSYSETATKEEMYSIIKKASENQLSEIKTIIPPEELKEYNQLAIKYTEASLFFGEYSEENANLLSQLSEDARKEFFIVSSKYGVSKKLAEELLDRQGIVFYRKSFLEKKGQNFNN